MDGYKHCHKHIKVCYRSGHFTRDKMFRHTFKSFGVFCFKRAEIYKSQSFVRLRLEATSATASRDGVYDIAISLDNKLYNHSLSSLHTHH